MMGIKTISLRPLDFDSLDFDSLDFDSLDFDSLDFDSTPAIHWTAMLHSGLRPGADRVWLLLAPMTFLIDCSGIGWL
jgi:hypothetical protein